MNYCNCADHRPIYFWAGPGTIRMNKTRFHAPFDAIDENVYLEGYREKGIDKLRNMGINVIYATFDWGYPPEIEKEDWQCFKRFTELAHQYKMGVFAYIQSNNIVWKEWFNYNPESREWICRSKEGKPFIYANIMPERYICCYNNPQWIDHLRKVTQEALNYGTDGIFYDNIHNPKNSICLCSSCRLKYEEYLDRKSLKPIRLENISDKGLDDTYFREWCRFRCESVNKFYREMRKVIDTFNPDIPLTSNTFEIVNHNNICGIGVDFSEIIKIENLWMIENFTLPRIEAGIQVNNARTFKVAKSYARDKLVTSVAYAPEAGTPLFGLCSGVYPPRQYKLGMAEASALQGSLVIKGTEYFDKYWTLITEDRFKKQREAIKEYNDFLASHSDLYENTEDVSNIGLLFSLSSLSWKHEKAFPSFCGFFQTLHQTNITFEILSEKDIEESDFRKKRLIILPNISCMSQEQVDNLLVFVKNGGKLLITGDIAIQKLDGGYYDTSINDSLLSDKNVTYFENCLALNEAQAEQSSTNESYYSSHFFNLPKNWVKIKDIILGLVKPLIDVKTDINQSVFIWKKSKEYIVHVVNYESDSTHEADIFFPKKIITIDSFSPDGLTKDRISFKANILTVKGTEIYDVIRVK